MRFSPDTSLLRSFIREDMPAGDITTDILIPRGVSMTASIVAREPGIVCGVGIIKRIYEIIDPRVSVTCLAADGRHVKKGKPVVRLHGNARSILKGERTALNLIQQLSGTATLTACYVRLTRGTKACIYDTRKTMPGLRAFQKYAVRCGGGVNHREHLSGAVLVKDNHMSIVMGSDRMKKAFRKWRKKKVFIEIEVDDRTQLPAMTALYPDVIMLDNFDHCSLISAVRYIKAHRKKGLPVIEVSGGVELKNVRKIALLGVERIAVGAITHSPPALDFSLECHR